jgi:hypothetical protein
MAAYPLPRREWPKCLLPYSEVKEIWVNGCKDGDDDWITPTHYTNAHTHTWATFRGGVICMPHRFLTRSRDLMLHELAHVLVGCHHKHDEIWENKFLQLGGTNHPIWRKLDPWRKLNICLLMVEDALRTIDKLPLHLVAHYK